MEVRFRARKALTHAEHAAIQRGAHELAESRLWWCGAPVVFVTNERRLECWLAVCFDSRDPEDAAMGALDLDVVCDFLRARSPLQDLKWDVFWPNGNAVLAHDGGAPALRAFREALGAASIDPDAVRARRAHRHEASDPSLPWGVGSRGLATSIAHAASVRASVRLEREPESEALREEIARERRVGKVRLGRFLFEAEGDDTRTRAIDRAALALDLRVLGPTWEPIAKERARFLFEALLRADLAYRSPLVDEARARAFAARFFDGFDAAASYVTNGTWDDSFCGGSSPIGDATFDVAVGAASETTVALMWIGDED